MVQVLQQNTWIDYRKFLKSCVRAIAEQHNLTRWSPEYGTWTVDFMLRQIESRALLGKYLNNPCVPWRHKRREMMAIAGIILLAKWLAKIKQWSDVGCRVCQRAREHRGASTQNLPEETCGPGTSTLPYAMKWQQPSRLHSTTSGGMCMPACKLHKLQRVSSGLSSLIKRVVSIRCGRRKSLSRYVAENRWRKMQ